MPDREKVIRSLEVRIISDTDAGYSTIEIPVNEAERILALLKEQEPIPCGEKIKAGDIVLDFYECGYCKNAIRKPWRYCPFCGKEVKWND